MILYKKRLLELMYQKEWLDGSNVNRNKQFEDTDLEIYEVVLATLMVDFKILFKKALKEFRTNRS